MTALLKATHVFYAKHKYGRNSLPTAVAGRYSRGFETRKRTADYRWHAKAQHTEDLNAD